MDYRNKRSLNLQFKSPEDAGKYNVTFTNNNYINKYGAWCDNGTASKTHIPLDGQEFYKDEITIVTKFTSSSFGDTATRLLFYAFPFSDRYFIYSDASGDLLVFLGGTPLTAIPNANYVDYLVDGENTFIVTADSSYSNVYLNGHNILLNDATAWTKNMIDEIYIGCNDSGSHGLGGFVNSIEVFQEAWSTDSVEAYFDNKLGLSTNDNNLYADLGGAQVVDKSKNGFDFTKVGTPTYDPELGGHVFDGSSDYYIMDGSKSVLNFISGTANCTLACIVNFDDIMADDILVLLGNTIASAEKGFVFYVTNKTSYGTPANIRIAVHRGVSGSSVLNSQSVNDIFSASDNGKDLFIAVSFDSSGEVFYVISEANGGLERTDTQSESIGTLLVGDYIRDVRIGSANNSLFDFKGLYKKAFIGDKKMSLNELRNLRTIMNTK